jgi:glycosyltransferase involved in cell wall biosynthesis
VVGFIDPRKDPLFALEVLTRIDGATLTFLGGPLAGDEAFATHLRSEVIRRGLDERVRITGYLTEEDLDTELGRLDIGLCLYTHAATSGSLSTLLAARRPVVASGLPIFREYTTAAPRAVTIVEMSPESAARAIAAIANRQPDWQRELDDLIQARSLANFGHAMWLAAGARGAAMTMATGSAGR